MCCRTISFLFSFFSTFFRSREILSDRLFKYLDAIPKRYVYISEYETIVFSKFAKVVILSFFKMSHGIRKRRVHDFIMGSDERPLIDQLWIHWTIMES